MRRAATPTVRATAPARVLALALGVLASLAGTARADVPAKVPATLPAGAPAGPIPLAPEVYASPVSGGCVLTGGNRCVVHVEPFTINVAAGRSLVAYQLVLNAVVVYDFRTDVSNPPFGDYKPTPVRREFAAYCGRSYTLALYGRDTGDPSFYVLGQTTTFQCPSCGATAPANVAGLVIAADRRTLHWTVQQAGTSYAVVKGDLPQLLTSGGSFPRSLTACLMTDSLATSATDAAVPAARGGFYYLVRARNCAGDTGSYDEDGSGLAAPRDAGIAASSYHCP